MARRPTPVSRTLSALGACAAAAVVLAGCTGLGGGGGETTVVVTRSPGASTAPESDGAGGATSGGQAPAAAPSALVEGAYPGAGGPRPANAQALPTYTSKYGGARSAHLLTPSGGIGCDFTAAGPGAEQGGCRVLAYQRSKLYGCTDHGSSCTPNTMYPFRDDRVQDISAPQGTAGFMNQPANDGYTVPRVEYGTVVYFDDWTCASESNGLTCWNTKTGSGVFLSNERSERFEGPGAKGASGGAAPAPAPAGGDDVVLGSLPSNGRGYGTSRPTMLDNGGSRSGRTEQISWSSWGGERAEGTGRGPNPMGAVADGAPDSSPVHLVAFELGQCDGRRAYRKLAVYAEGGSFDPANANAVCWTER